MPPPRSHSLEQHNYADHKKQPTTATGKDTKDKNYPFAPSHPRNIKRELRETHTPMTSKIYKRASFKKAYFDPKNYTF